MGFFCLFHTNIDQYNIIDGIRTTS